MRKLVSGEVVPSIGRECNLDAACTILHVLSSVYTLVKGRV